MANIDIDDASMVFILAEEDFYKYVSNGSADSDTYVADDKQLFSGVTGINENRGMHSDPGIFDNRGMPAAFADQSNGADAYDVIDTTGFGHESDTNEKEEGPDDPVGDLYVRLFG